MRSCPKCKKLTFAWNYPSRTKFCVNADCAFMAVEVYATGCHVGSWEFYLASDGEFYIEWDGMQPAPFAERGYKDNKSIREAAERMTRNLASPDLVNLFLKKCLRPEQGSRDA